MTGEPEHRGTVLDRPKRCGIDEIAGVAGDEKLGEKMARRSEEAMFELRKAHRKTLSARDVRRKPMSSKHTLGDAPIEAEYRDKMMHLAGALDYMFNGDGKGGVKRDRKVGFVVLVFPFGDKAASRCNFISNGADGRDIVTLFREMIARFEEPEASGHA